MLLMHVVVEIETWPAASYFCSSDGVSKRRNSEESFKAELSLHNWEN